MAPQGQAGLGSCARDVHIHPLNAALAHTQPGGKRLKRVSSPQQAALSSSARAGVEVGENQSRPGGISLTQSGV